MKKLLFALAVSVAVMAPAAQAGAIFVTLDPAFATGVPGATLPFYGTIMAPLDNEYDLNLDGASVDLLGPLMADTSPFLLTPLYLSPGESYTGLLFNVTINPGAAQGRYDGVFHIYYSGVDVEDGDAPAAFYVNVSPEPGALPLLASGLGALALAARRKRRV